MDPNKNSDSNSLSCAVPNHFRTSTQHPELKRHYDYYSQQQVWYRKVVCLYIAYRVILNILLHGTIVY